MSDSLKYVREVAKSIGLALPEEREAAIAEAVAAALNQVEVIRVDSTPVPAPTAYDASWSEQK